MYILYEKIVEEQWTKLDDGVYGKEIYFEMNVEDIDLLYFWWLDTIV